MNLVVDGHVIHLRVRQSIAVPRAAAVLRDREPLIVADYHAIGVAWSIHMSWVIASGRARAGLLHERLAAVERRAVAGSQKVGFILVVRRHEDV